MADVDGAEKSDANDKTRQDASVSESSDREVSEAFGATGNPVGEHATSGVNGHDHEQGGQQQHADDASNPNADGKHENGLTEKTDKPRSPVEIYDPSKHSPPVETLSPKGKRLQSTGDDPDELPSENLLNGADKQQSELPRGGDDKLRTSLRTGDLSTESYRKMKLELDHVRVELRLLSDRNSLLASENAKLRSKLVDNIKRRTCSSALTTLASGPTDSYRRSTNDTRRTVSPLRTLHSFDYAASASKREEFLSADSSRSESRASSSDENDIALMHKTDASQLYTRTVLQHGNSLRDLSSKTSFSSRYESSYTPRYSHYPTAVRYSSIAINEREREREREREQREYERERERRHALIRRIEQSRLLATSPSRELRESWSASASASARKSTAYDSSTLARGWRQRPFAPSHYSEVRVGDDVKFTHRGAIGRARVLFVGHVMRDERVLIGLEVTDECALSVADCDGLLHGVRYFRTRPNRALFVPIDNVLLVL